MTQNQNWKYSVLGNQVIMDATDERQGPQSTILYLLQETSKCIEPIQNGCLGNNSYFSWTESENSVPTRCLDSTSSMAENSKHNNPLTTATPSCTHSSQVTPCGSSLATSDSEQCVRSVTQADPQSVSSWDAMSQINLQCERLLSSRATSECDSFHSAVPSLDSVVSAAGSDDAYFKPGLGDSSDSIPSMVSPVPDVTGVVSRHDDGCNLMSIHHSMVAGRDMEDQEEAWTGSSQDEKEGATLWKISYDSRASTGHQEVPVCSVKYFSGSTFQLRTDASFDAGNSTEPCGLNSNKENGEDCVSAARHHLIELPGFEDAYVETTAPALDGVFAPLCQGPGCHAAGKLFDVPLGLSESTTEYESIQSEPTLTLDFNSNLTFEPRHDGPFRHPSQTLTHTSYSDPVPRGPTEPGSTTKAPDALYTSSRETTPLTVADSVTDSPGVLKRRSGDPTGARPVLVQSPSHGPRRTTRTPRKQSRPSRSVTDCDPHFQGVAFRMQTELGNGMEQCRLLITSKYSEDLWKSVRGTRGRSRSSQSSFRTSSSDEDSDHSLYKKVCASCCTKKTPLWRDADDGTPLCNACGIRYKKYRVRCPRCWYIPRKEGNSSLCCVRCGDLLRLTMTQHRYANSSLETY